MPKINIETFFEVMQKNRNKLCLHQNNITVNCGSNAPLFACNCLFSVLH